MKYIFHYCAMYQPGPARVAYWDGLLYLNAPPVTLEALNKIKAEIADIYIVGVDGKIEPEQITLLSLNLITKSE